MKTDSELEIEELKEEIQALSLKNAKLTAQLREAADVMAEIGKIHNTPYAKRQWVEG